MHLKIVVDVIKDTANIERGMQEACCKNDLSKKKGFSLVAPLGVLHLDVT